MPSVGLRLLSLIPMSNLTNHVLWILFLVLPMILRSIYQVCTRYLIEFFSPVSVSFVTFRACTCFERIRKPSRSLRGLRWPEGNERFKGVCGACSKIRKLERYLPHYYTVSSYRYSSSVVSLPFTWNTVFCSTGRVKIREYQTLGIMASLHPLPHHC